MNNQNNIEAYVQNFFKRKNNNLFEENPCCNRSIVFDRDEIRCDICDLILVYRSPDNTYHIF